MIPKATLNPQAWAIEETESEIRELVMRSVMRQRPKTDIDKDFRALLARSLKPIKIPSLRAAAIRSLTHFYIKQYRTALTLYGGDISTLVLLFALTEKSKSEKERESIYEKLPPATKIGLETFKMTVPTFGVPNREFCKDYINDKVKPTLDRLCQQHSIDPDDIEGRGSLRNRAEMEVRYQKHLDDIAELKAAGHRLVICSTHADCSKRCAPWQGRVFSLDHTSGTTDDGRKFVPLEEATDQNQVYWTNPDTGTQYRGGLLGYNCRHFLVPYKSGYQFPEPDRKMEREQYEITVKQRYLERQVRKWKVEALTSRYADKKRYEFAKTKTKYWNDLYENYSKKHDRAFYRSRVQII